MTAGAAENYATWQGETPTRPVDASLFQGLIDIWANVSFCQLHPDTSVKSFTVVNRLAAASIFGFSMQLHLPGAW